MHATGRVIASARTIVAISEVTALLIKAAAEQRFFSEAELRYARSKSDPERRLAARLAAKRATQDLLGHDLALHEIEILPSLGAPPRLALTPRLRTRIEERGAGNVFLSLTHGLTHAAAAVILVSPAA
ncbi:MAG: holo-ACP synthase [Vicinamibacteria bacterium]|jgi:holo-[acyl-carrier-protein] synthase|nr:holo-ACP synthase [Vicinamibacteria bacterium]